MAMYVHPADRERLLARLREKGRVRDWGTAAFGIGSVSRCDCVNLPLLL